MSLGSKCVIGEWKTIENMLVTAVKNNWRVSNHMYKITFIGQTKITNCDIENDDMFHSLMEFDTILSGTMQPNLLFGN